MENGRYILTAEDVVKSFPQKRGGRTIALAGVSLAVRRGGTTAVVGPDGAGKTTLLRILAGLMRPDAGTLSFNGRPWPTRPETLQENIGYMPQRFGLYEDLSVQENMNLYADLRGLLQDEREERGRELLAMSGMSPFRNRLAGRLSGGMKQKLGLICTLLRPPALLILDEPTVGVDPLSRRELRQMTDQLAAESGMSVLVGTSYLDEASHCDETVMLFEGGVLARDAPESIRDRSAGMARLASPAPGDTPRSLQARIFGAPGVVDAVPQGGAVRVVHGPLEEGQAAELKKRLRGAETHAAPPSLEDSFMLLLYERLGPLRRASESDARPPARQTSWESEQKTTPDADDGEPVIRTENVSRRFGDFVAVDNVSFSVRKGEVFGLLGPNGAGKTTTFRMLCGLLPASGGRLYVAGTDVRKTREEARRHIGYVAQKFSLYGPLSVKENLEFFAGAYGMHGETGKRRIREVLADFSLEPYLDAPAEALPGGCKQRLSMAVGLLHNPKILFLDEPTSGADPPARREFWKRISGLADQGVTIVVTTHFMEEAEYCDRVLIQDNGVMLALDAPAAIRASVASNAGEDVAMEDAFIRIVQTARNNPGKEGA